ncbi:hypothetical protein N9X24_02280 [Rickettsiales bacterium]|nr:hypothetical protein [Rickettsiales bacterium]
MKLSKKEWIKSRMLEMKKDILLSLAIFFSYFLAFQSYKHYHAYFKHNLNDYLDHLLSYLALESILILIIIIFSMILSVFNRNLNYLISASILGYCSASILSPFFLGSDMPFLRFILSLPASMALVLIFVISYNKLLKDKIDRKYVFMLTFLSFNFGMILAGSIIKLL